MKRIADAEAKDLSRVLDAAELAPVDRVAFFSLNGCLYAREGNGLISEVGLDDAKKLLEPQTRPVQTIPILKPLLKSMF